MALADRLRHELVILRRTDGVEDERGVPAMTWTSLASVRGWIQPRARRSDAIREQTDQTQAGAVVADHLIFLLPTDVKAADMIRLDPDDGRRFEITGVRDAGGRQHHLELDARTVSR